MPFETADTNQAPENRSDVALLSLPCKQSDRRTYKLKSQVICYPYSPDSNGFQTTSFPLAIYKERSKQMASYGETNSMLLLVFSCRVLSEICSRRTSGFIKASLKKYRSSGYDINTGEGIVYMFRDFINHCLNLMLLGGVI